MTAAAIHADARMPGESARRAECLCAHCSLPVPAGLIQSEAEHQFCCQGCRGAYDVIHTCGLEGYYRLLNRVGDRATRGEADAASAGRFHEFDDPAFAAHYCDDLPGGVRRVELVLEGMHCAACVWLLERLPRVVPGVQSASVSLSRRSVDVVYDASAAPLSTVAHALATLGYTPHAPRENAAREAQRLDDRRQLVRLAVAGACAGNVMLMAFALYGGLFQGSLTPTLEGIFRWLSLAMMLICVAWPGRDLLRGAWNSIRHRTPSIDGPIALAVVAGGVMGTINTVLNRGEIYFDSLTMLMFLLCVGRYIGGRRQRAATDSVELLFALTSGAATRVETDGSRLRIPIESLRVGDLLEVLAGQSIPADGLVTQGRSSVDQSMLTGEARPVRVGEGDTVLAACTNLESPLIMRVATTGRQTRAGRLMRLVEDAATRKPSIALFADRISWPFTLAVAVAAAVTAAAWWSVGPSIAIDHAVSLLIVTCPCALGIAAPLAIGVAVGRGARRGMLIKGGDVFERLAKPGLILLDKTGTLTHGRMRVDRTFGDARSLALAATLERQATHPVARAIADGITPLETAQVAAIQRDRGGIEGDVDGIRVIVGNAEFMRSMNVTLADKPAAWLDQCRRDGLTTVVIAVDGHASAVIGLGDVPREDSRACVERLRSRGWRVGMLSGDERSVCEMVADRVGIARDEVRAAAMPEDKATIVREAVSRGETVVMVGDGVNDAAALASATVGIAVHGGAEASLTAADVYLASPGLEPVVDMIDAGPRVVRTLRRIFLVSTTYNLIAGTLAVSGVIHPIIAAIMMPLSSISVISVAMRSRTFPRQDVKGAHTWT